MFVDEYPNLNNTTSYIIDDNVDVPPAPPNPNSIILLGTATRGPLYKPVLMTDDTVEDIFGTYVDDAYGDTMLIKAYREAKAMFPGAVIYGVRIGNATRAKLDLYEHRLFSSGNMSPTGVTPAMRIISKSDGENNTSVVIRGDASGFPTSMDVSLPDGVTLNYQLDVYGNVPGAYYRVSDLVNALNNNPNFSKYNIAQVNVLTAEVDVEIVESSLVPGKVETVYDIDSLTDGSYGDKLIDILKAYRKSQVVDSDSVKAGDTKATLAYTPNKDADPNTETIDVFSVIKKGELVLSATSADIGSTTLTLGCKNDSHWDYTDDTYNITDLVLTKVVGGNPTVLVEGTDYTINKNTAEITLNEPVNAGDKYYADYKYKVTFVEANVRSDLQIGNPYSYFIYGDEIIFGAAQRNNLELRYRSNNEYKIGSDIVITDAKNTVVRFVNPDNLPNIGDVVTFVLVYEPELPAVTGTVISDGIVQESNLTGGSDGRRIVGKALYDELEKGYQGSENLPARYIVPVGVHIDNTIESVDFETGLPTTVNAGFLEQLSRYVKRKSMYVSECFGIITPKPIEANNPDEPTLEEINRWYDRLVNVSATDTTRAANQLASFDDYHIIVPVGDAIFQIPSIKGGRPYVGQFAAIHAAIMQNMNPNRAIVNMNINAGPIQRFVYPVMSNEKVNAINGARYTLYTQSSIDGSYTIVDSPTLARKGSKFDRQFVTQTVFDIIQTARRVAKPFFGQVGSNSVRKSLETSIYNKVIDEFHPERISGFQVTVFATPADKISGKTQVLLRIVTSKEIRKIQFTTQLELV